jgi:hypothetical protein
MTLDGDDDAMIISLREGGERVAAGRLSLLKSTGAKPSLELVGVQTPRRGEFNQQSGPLS